MHCEVPIAPVGPRHRQPPELVSHGDRGNFRTLGCDSRCTTFSGGFMWKICVSDGLNSQLRAGGDPRLAGPVAGLPLTGPGAGAASSPAAREIPDQAHKGQADYDTMFPQDVNDSSEADACLRINR